MYLYNQQYYDLTSTYAGTANSGPLSLDGADSYLVLLTQTFSDIKAISMCSYQSYFTQDKGCSACDKDSYAASLRSARCYSCQTEVNDEQYLAKEGLSSFEIAKLKGLCDYD